MATEADFYEKILRIPAGKVATYGDIAGFCGDRKAAVAVGTALGKWSRDQDLPWWRVTRAKGRLADAAPHDQRARLEAEQVTFKADGSVDLIRHRWEGLGA